MASISKRKNGLWFLRFVRANGERPTMALGTKSERQAVAIRGYVENILASQENGQAVDPGTVAWLSQISPKMRQRLINVKLITVVADEADARKPSALGPWLTEYLKLRADVKPGTKLAYAQTKRCLIDHFGSDKLLAEITAGDADAWRIWLADNQKLSRTTANRRCGIAKQFFRAAMRRRLMAENPFADMRGISTQKNPERFYFVSRAEADKVLAACPDDEWKLLFALSRYAGLRCPSEHLGLTWGDIDWERNRMLVRSPKTEHHEGKAERWVPIFPEVKPYLDAVYFAPQLGDHVITRYRSTNVNLRTQLKRIVNKAGLTVWPKLFQNLRSTRQTELAEQFPIHVVCAWIGNSADVAKDHYLQVTDAHFDRASGALQMRSSNTLQEAGKADCDTLDTAENCGIPQGVAIKVGPVGFEPTTKGL